MTYLISLNYNNSQLTIEFLESLRPVKTEFRLILVDNHSTIEDFEVLRSFIEKDNQSQFIPQEIEYYRFDKQIRTLLVREDKNLGFAAGNNRGIEIARNQQDFEAVVLINNDTEVDPHFLDEILNFRKQNEAADLIGCRIFFDAPKNVLWYDGGKYYKHTCRAEHINENKHVSQVQALITPQKTTFITGCFMYISKRCLDRIGLLNDTFFMYNEDLEYCIRAMKNGLSLYYVPTAIIRHKIKPVSSAFSTYWGARNRFKLAKLHSSKIDQLITFAFYIFTRFPRFAVWFKEGRTELIKAQLKGMIDGLKNK